MYRRRKASTSEQNLPVGSGKEEILNKFQNSTDQIPHADFLAAADAFVNALKNLQPDEDCNKVLPKLFAIQNQINKKIRFLQKFKREKGVAQSAISALITSKLMAGSTGSLSSDSSSVGRNSSQSKNTGGKSTESGCGEHGTLSTSKLFTTSKQSLCSDEEVIIEKTLLDNDKRYEDFWNSVNCPFCFKLEVHKVSLVKHIYESCIPFKTKKFTESPRKDFSVFKILRHSFKCNICVKTVQLTSIKQYYEHLQSKGHCSAYKKAALLKHYTELLFCCFCKVQIPNNATQLLSHLEHKIHERRSEFNVNSVNLRKKGVQCVYNRDKKFKCLVCPSVKCDNIYKILQHFYSKFNFIKSEMFLQKPFLYCAFCFVELPFFHGIYHLCSEDHKKKEEEEAEPFELCLYCGFDCANLSELALHMELTCSEIHEIAEINGFQKSEEFNEALKTVPKEDNSKKDQEIPVKEKNEEHQERRREEDANDLGRCVQVFLNDCTDTSELFRSFKKFCEISGLETTDKESGLLKFQEEKEAVDSFLELCEMIRVKGVKPEITTFGESDTRKDGSKRDNKDPPSNASNNGSYCSSSSSSGNHSGNGESDSHVALNDDPSLENLFYRVSTHLTNTLLQPDSLDIVDDCNKNIKQGKFEYVGFLKCGLTFPVEHITLHCQLENELTTGKREYSSCLIESTLFNKLMAQKFVGFLKSSDMARRVSISDDTSFPFVKFYHAKTGKVCTITFRKSCTALTDMLGCCLTQNKNVRDFILITRFWFSVHKLAIMDFEFVIISLILFFLINSKAANVSLKSFENCRGHTILRETVKNSGAPQLTPEHSERSKVIPNKGWILDMFQSFLCFLNSFDFKNNAICLPLQYPVPKTLLLKEPLREFLSPSLWEKDLECSMWIMDPFLFNNLAMDLRKCDMESFLKTVRDTVEHYKIC